MKDSVKWWAPILLASGISVFIGAISWGARAKGDVDQAKVAQTVTAAVAPVESRVTKLETQRVEDEKRQERIEKKVDDVQQDIDALKTLIIERLPKK